MNNLAYYGKRVSSVRGATALDYVGNVNIENPSDPRVSGGTLTRNTSDQTNYPGYPSIYMEDNIDTHESDNVATVRADTESLLVNSRQVSSGYVPIPASEVHQYIKDNVGANLYRDAADTRVLNDIENLTGGRIFGEDEVGGFPVIPENTRGNNFYAGSSHISQAFYDEHNLSGDGTSVTINWDFGTYQVINNAGYTDREIYWAWLANDFENLEGNEIPASFLINEIPQEVTSYSSQDNGGFEVMDSGTTLKLTGNSWKKVPLQYTITPNTLLEFEFKVDGTGEIHGIGFDDDTSLNTSGSPDELFFKLFGTQDVTWDNNDFENYTTGDGWKSYSIPVGEYITGDKKYLVFVGDKDSNSSSQNSSFRIVSLREENTTNCPNTPYELTASDSDGSNVPCNLVDDDLGTRWGANGDGEWVMFDLGSVQEVNQIQIAFHRGDLRTAFFDVQVSDDAVTWTDVYGSQQQSSGTTLQLQDFDFPLQNARYVRYLGHGNSENAWNSLLEMRVNRTVANCPGSPYGISASGSDGSNVPCNLVDDDLGTRWGANGDGEWVMFDLGSVQEVNQIQVAFYRGDLRTAFFDVQVSDDAVTWSDVYGSQQQSSGTTLQLQDFDFPLQNARYVRYLGHGNSENAWNSLLEMRVNRTVDPQELILQPIQDAYLQGSTRYNNNLLRVNQGSRIAYLKYDLSSINGEITDAKLHFRVASDTGSGIAEVHKASNTNWTETNLGDSNKPSETALWGTTTDLGQTSADVVVSLSTDRFFGGGALSLIVKHVGSNDFALASKENTTFPAPRLVLTYRPTSSLRAKIMNTKLPYSDLIMLYPNPTTKMVNIMGITGRKNILIMDFSGKVLHREASTTLEPSLDLSRYAPGTYYISVSGNVENKTFKVIKK
jgi:hypothetical protein